MLRRTREPFRMHQPNKPELILASSSPRRQELLREIGIPFRARVPDAAVKTKLKSSRFVGLMHPEWFRVLLNIRVTIGTLSNAMSSKGMLTESPTSCLARILPAISCRFSRLAPSAQTVTLRLINNNEGRWIGRPSAHSRRLRAPAMIFYIVDQK